MTVTAKHPSYVENIDLWHKVDDVCKGQHAVKAGREKYLPRHNKSDTSTQAMDAYNAYLESAVFYGVTGKTLNSLVGAAFGKLPNFQRPDDLEYLERNANGQGVSIYQLGQAALRYLLKNYRCGIYVDFPHVEPSRTKADDAVKRAYPMIHIINPKSIINWDTVMVGNQQKLSLLVIHEDISERDADGFDFKIKTQYRVLRLENGVFTIQLYVKSGDEGFVPSKKYEPTDYNGNKWDYIPFSFIGAIDNAPIIDNAPLLELADLNLAHYRDSADFQESVYFVGQPQFYMPDIDITMYEQVKKDGLYIGCKNAYPTQIGIAQASPNTLSKQAMDDKWQQMKELGARLVEIGGGNRTATEIVSNDAVRYSVLSLCVVNISQAFTQALRWCAKFALPNVDAIDTLSYEISQEFNNSSFDSSLAAQIWAAAVAGKISYATYWDYLATGELPQHGYDIELSRIENPNPMDVPI